MDQEIRSILAKHANMGDGVAALSNDSDLFAAGLTSFGSVQLMLALEEHFDVEFPERMLNRKTFSTIAAIAAALSEIKPERLAS